MKLSIIIPFFNEEKNVLPVLAEVAQHHPDAEIIAVDDGSRDRTWLMLSTEPGIRTHRFGRHLGQSAAVYAGLVLSTGDICVILDGDGQSSIADIKALLAHFPEHDFVNGRRLHRHDTPGRILASRAANFVRDLLTNDGMHDTGCTPKALKRECVDHLVPFDGLHRFIPALLNSAGFRGIEVPVAHHARLHGRTHYSSWPRAFRGLWDLVGVRWWMARQLDVGAMGLSSAPDRSRLTLDDARGPVDFSRPDDSG
jgi:dolichol-phosphate mannosyltransferase